jgi:Cell Wall Hydrolase
MAWGSPEARDMVIRTILGEAAGEGPAGWRAVAHVIRNRYNSGAWGQGFRAILTPSQFQAWNPANKSAYELTRIGADDPRYQRIGAVVDTVFNDTDPDPTGGANHYYNPTTSNPDWGPRLQNTQQIGSHRFGTIPTSGGQRMTPASSEGVDPRLTAVLRAASVSLPQGWRMEITSGKRDPNLDPRFHGKGLATDVQLIDPQGRRVSNYQNAAAFPVYEQFAHAVREQQMKLHPELANSLRWGGYFWNGGPGNYGNMDLMHFDLGGDRVGTGAGGWNTGLNAMAAKAYGLKPGFQFNRQQPAVAQTQPNPLLNPNPLSTVAPVVAGGFTPRDAYPYVKPKIVQTGVVTPAPDAGSAPAAGTLTRGPVGTVTPRPVVPAVQPGGGYDNPDSLTPALTRPPAPPAAGYDNPDSLTPVFKPTPADDQILTSSVNPPLPPRRPEELQPQAASFADPNLDWATMLDIARGGMGVPGRVTASAQNANPLGWIGRLFG